jgi:sphinganine-1-phosphate aldolase
MKGLCILGQPPMTAFAIGSDDPEVSVLAVADVMEERGWKMERQQLPDSLHCSIMPHHIAVADQLISDLGDAAARVKVRFVNYYDY